MAWAHGFDHPAQIWLISLYLAGLGALLVDRAGLQAFVQAKARQGLFDRRIAIVGGGAAAEALIGALEGSVDAGIKIIGVFDDRNDDRSTESVAGHPKLGNVSDLVTYARQSRVDLIVFTVPISAEARILQMLAKLWVLPIDIRLSAHSTKLRLRPRAYSYLGAVPVLDVFDKPLADWDVIVKSAFDWVVALAALVALSPVMLAVALAVKLTSRGPILFKQKRYGFNNELIEVFKFRSMYVDQGDAAAAKLVSKDDPRVTPVGRVIRKTSLDELPQLFNVLKGDLSLVGPRPHALQAKAANTLYDQVVDGYFARHKVKPGITGWAQINGWRGETDTSEKIERRVEHDLYYIENWSILLDLKILVKTPFALLNTKNAY
jgi:Undecaprenyl-phosphate glucose phosphotransferase